METIRLKKKNPLSNIAMTSKRQHGLISDDPDLTNNMLVSTLTFSIGKILALAVAGGTIYATTESALYCISPAGDVQMLAGSNTEMGYADGQGAIARFNRPRGLVVSNDGSLLVADTFNHRLRRVSPCGSVSTFAGSGLGSFADGMGLNAHFNHPYGIAVDGHGAIYVSDYNNHCVRKVTPDSFVSTLCGSMQRKSGFTDESGVAARFNCPAGLALDMDGNLIVADCSNHCIRKVVPSDGRVSTVAGSRAGGWSGKGFADGEVAAARFSFPRAVAVDGCTGIFVADSSNHRVRMIKGERVTTIAGSSVNGHLDGEGASARFGSLFALALDKFRRLLVADNYSNGNLRAVVFPLACVGGGGATGGSLFLAAKNQKSKVEGGKRGGGGSEGGCMKNDAVTQNDRSIQRGDKLRVLSNEKVVENAFKNSDVSWQVKQIYTHTHTHSLSLSLPLPLSLSLRVSMHACVCVRVCVSLALSLSRSCSLLCVFTCTIVSACP